MERRDCPGLRVLLVGTYPPPYGGIATHLVALIPGLKARGAEDIAVVTIGADDKIQQFDSATIYRFCIKRHLRALLNPANWPLVLRVLACLAGERLTVQALVGEAVKAILVDRVARSHASEVVGFYHSNTHFELLPLARRWGRTRAIVLAVFGEVYDSPDFMARHKSLMQKILGTPDAVWASSDHCARSFSTIGITRPIETVYVGVDVDGDAAADHELRARFRTEQGIRDDDVVVLFFGRFIKDMGLDIVLQTIPLLVRESERVKFVLAGAKGELLADVQEVAKAHLGRVIVQNDVPFSTQAMLYCGCDIVVAPSFSQRACMGLSIKEAMAAGRPVVASDAGGIPEAVVHGTNGFLVPLDPATSAADVTQCKESLLTLVNDAALRAQFGRAGRERTRQMFSDEETSNRLAGIFMSVRPARGAAPSLT